MERVTIERHGPEREKVLYLRRRYVVPVLADGHLCLACSTSRMPIPLTPLTCTTMKRQDEFDLHLILGLERVAPRRDGTGVGIMYLAAFR